jgi:hypothetical protein
MKFSRKTAMSALAPTLLLAVALGNAQAQKLHDG